MNNYVLSQILVLISSAFIGISYFAKTKKNIMLLCVIYCIFYSSHYLLLKAYTGMLMSLISAIRNIWFYKNAKKNINNNNKTLLLFVTLAICMGIYSYQDWFSIISITANVLSTYSIWQDDVKKYRLIAIPVSLCFIIYAIHINSILSLIMEIV